MIIEYNNKHYEILFGSDVINDGVYLEMNDTSIENEETLLFAFRSDADGSFTFSAFHETVPFKLVELFVREVRRRLPPSSESSHLGESCCVRMAEIAKVKCDIHSNPFDCPDYLIHYSPEYNEFGLVIHDGGTSSVTINFCPWCGSKLSESKRGFNEKSAC